MTIAVDLGRKATKTKQTKNLTSLNVNEPYVHRQHHGLFWVFFGPKFGPISNGIKETFFTNFEEKNPIFFFFFGRL